MKIAIIEDDEITRLELSKLLKKQGYGTVLLTNFKNLTEELSQYVVDLVLLDINLPYENGYEICKKMKKVQQVPVIFVTSRDSSADELKSILYKKTLELEQEKVKQDILKRLCNGESLEKLEQEINNINSKSISISCHIFNKNRNVKYLP